MKGSFLYILLLLPLLSFAQNDTIYFKNQDVMVGEIKSLNTGVMVVKTRYSDKDFQIEFSGVSRLEIQKNSLIVLTGGRRKFGKLTSPEDGKVTILLADGTEENYDLDEIVILDEIDDKFFKRIKASIDIGFTLTRANNKAELQVGGKADYSGVKWRSGLSINSLRSVQDNIDPIERTEANFEVLRLLGRKWFVFASPAYLSNTQQALKYRISTNLAGGRFLVSTNKLFWGLAVGFNFNFEQFDDGAPEKQSTELLLSTNFNIFDFKDLDLDTSLNLYPSLSERGRFRADYDITFKYDLPWDFYIKLGFNLNYDNQPAVVGNEFDYVLTSGFGWEWK